MKMMKTLDVQWGTPKMPDDVRRFFFNYYENVGNDVWVEYTVGYSSDDEGEDSDNLSILDKWLLDNCDVTKGEEILLKHWW